MNRTLFAASIVLAMAAAAAAAAPGPHWRNIGPGGGGWIQSICASPHDVDELFVGCDVGGFYYSSNGGAGYTIHNTGQLIGLSGPGAASRPGPAQDRAAAWRLDCVRLGAGVRRYHRRASPAAFRRTCAGRERFQSAMRSSMV